MTREYTFKISGKITEAYGGMVDHDAPDHFLEYMTEGDTVFLILSATDLPQAKGKFNETLGVYGLIATITGSEIYNEAGEGYDGED